MIATPDRVPLMLNNAERSQPRTTKVPRIEPPPLIPIGMSGWSVVKEEQVRILVDASENTQLSDEDAIRLIRIPDQACLLKRGTARKPKNRTRWVPEMPQHGVKTRDRAP